jgi:hypothetical protein
MSQTRRLAAILAADVAGYSLLMGADEEGTHERLQTHLRELVNPKIAEHRGRIVKNTTPSESHPRQPPRRPNRKLVLANWSCASGAIAPRQAIFWFENARSANVGHPISHIFLASAHSLKGEIEHAATKLAEARRLSDDERYSNIARVPADRNWGVPKIRALFEATYFAGLRKAGMPEE